MPRIQVRVEDQKLAPVRCGCGCRCGRAFGGTTGGIVRVRALGTLVPLRNVPQGGFDPLVGPGTTHPKGVFPAVQAGKGGSGSIVEASRTLPVKPERVDQFAETREPERERGSSAPPRVAAVVAAVAAAVATAAAIAIAIAAAIATAAFCEPQEPRRKPGRRSPGRNRVFDASGEFPDPAAPHWFRGLRKPNAEKTTSDSNV